MNSHYIETVKSFVAKQSFFSQDVHYGALRCASCSSYHLLSSILVYPFACAANYSNSFELIDAYSRLVNWTCARQEPLGCWVCDSDQSLVNKLLFFALSNAYLVGQHLLSEIENAGFLETLRRFLAWSRRDVLDDSPLHHSLSLLIDRIRPLEGPSVGFRLQEIPTRYGVPLIESVESIMSDQVAGEDCLLQSASAIFCETLRMDFGGSNECIN